MLGMIYKMYTRVYAAMHVFRPSMRIKICLDGLLNYVEDLRQEIG